MALVNAFYSIKGNVHHVCTRCTLGNNIEPENKRNGKGGKTALPSMCSEKKG